MPQFRDPTTGGDKLPLDELRYPLLLFSVHEQMPEMQTSFGVATPIRADVAVLDGARKGEAFADALIFPRVLQGNLRGAIGEMVIGRLGKRTTRPSASRRRGCWRPSPEYRQGRRRAVPGPRRRPRSQLAEEPF